ncbi:DUF1853 family protein [Bizionia argentinensis JUB59]|uniref:DUF1853 family protein n=1 Tax=Bizionia argentinensis JUB59 TaxID=1046627 RepID=G2E9M9_9FLAO|nr:DUF1853 family protein [Bizionia argentinensis]EGV44908.1 DUF1853 family protein [Bizionia argentinensis JUB59]
MQSESENIQRQYQGYKQTPNLWAGDAVFGISQFLLVEKYKETFKRTLPDNLRLGKRVEQFVYNELEHGKSISILVENIQIQDQKQTIGEMDAIFTYQDKPIHLEIVYKFYVYDESIGTSELDHFIGPNRKDSLVEKLTKLTIKQLPLLYKHQTETLLHDLKLDVKTIAQKVCFKAQLFLPYNKNVDLKVVNQKCVVGYYLKAEDLLNFKTSSFYFPSKPNWLQQPHDAVTWKDYASSHGDFTQIHNEKHAACCWIKRPDNSIDKYFIVWW